MLLVLCWYITCMLRLARPRHRILRRSTCSTVCDRRRSCEFVDFRNSMRVLGPIASKDRVSQLVVWNSFEGALEQQMVMLVRGGGINTCPERRQVVRYLPGSVGLSYTRVLDYYCSCWIAISISL